MTTALGVWIAIGPPPLTYSAFAPRSSGASKAFVDYLSPIHQQTRLKHAKELLGSHFKKSVVGKFETVSDLYEKVLSETHEGLPQKYQRQGPKISKAILRESHRYGFDPLFIVAIIQSESSYNPEVRGRAGELGLMQILPETGKWIAKKYGIRWKGTASLKNPTQNIKIGAAYLAYLRTKFEQHGQLYLSAYNMGPLNVKRSVDKNILPKEYAGRVMKNYVKIYSEMVEPLEESKAARAIASR